MWLVLGLLLRVLLIVFPRSLDDDTAVYLELGRNLLHHHVYGLMSDSGVLVPSLFRLPGYPIFLALLGGRLWLVELVQSGLDLFGCWLLACAVRTRLGDRAAEWTFALGSLCLFTAAYAATALTESLSVFAVCWGIYGFARWSKERRAGMVVSMAGAAALAMLLRPDGVLLLVALVFGVAVTSRGLRDVVLLAVVACLPLGVWGARNYATFHVIQPLAPRHVNDPGERVNLGFYRWLRTWSTEFVTTGNVFWSVGADALNIDDVPARAFDSAAQRAETAELFDVYNRQGHQVDGPLDARFAALAAARVAAHPVSYYVVVPMARIADMLLRPRTETYDLDAAWWQVGEHPWQSAAAIGLGVVNLAYMLAALCGVVRRRVPFGVVLGSYFVLRCVLLGTLENSEPRYSLELYPMVVIAAAAMLAGWRSGVGSVVAKEFAGGFGDEGEDDEAGLPGERGY